MPQIHAGHGIRVVCCIDDPVGKVKAPGNLLGVYRSF